MAEDDRVMQLKVVWSPRPDKTESNQSPRAPLEKVTDRLWGHSERDVVKQTEHRDVAVALRGP